jgi:hypothetical protein
MLSLILLAVVIAAAELCDVYDVTETVKGITKGIAVEGNTLLLSSDKPTALALYLRDGLIIALASVPAVVCLALHATPFFYAALGGPAIAAVKHILGGRAWVKLLAGQKPTAAEEIAPGSN